MLACALPRQRFELISRWHREIAQLLRSLQLQQLPESDSSNIPVPLRFFIDPEILSLLVAKRKNHPRRYTIILSGGEPPPSIHSYTARICPPIRGHENFVATRARPRFPIWLRSLSLISRSTFQTGGNLLRTRPNSQRCISLEAFRQITLGRHEYGLRV